MKTQIVKINQIKSNPNNPRIIKDDKFKQLVESINNFPEMRDVRPIVVNKEMIILGGNMRWKAMQEAGVKEVPILIVDWDEEKQKEFVIKDNIGYGEWNWDILANEWDSDKLNDWGLNVPQFETKVDYSILDEIDLSSELSDMSNGVKKAIQIEFEAEHYDEANELVKFWREQKLYIGGFLMEKLKEEKSKL